LFHLTILPSVMVSLSRGILITSAIMQLSVYG